MKKQFLSSLLLYFSLLHLAVAQDIPVSDLHLENYKYPYPVSFIHLSIQNGDYKMAYMDVKPQKPNGQVVMLLHGKNFNGAYWGETASVLAKNGYRVIIPDQLG